MGAGRVVQGWSAGGCAGISVVKERGRVPASCRAVLKAARLGLSPIAEMIQVWQVARISMQRFGIYFGLWNE